MEIASLIVGIICMILLIVLIFRKGGTGGDEGFSSEELEALAEQMDTLRKEHREGQSELRRELNTMLNDAMRTLNDQTQSNQRHWAGVPTTIVKTSPTRDFLINAYPKKFNVLPRYIGALNKLKGKLVIIEGKRNPYASPLKVPTMPNL